MHKLPDETLDNAINVYEISIKTLEECKDTDYCNALDKVTVAFLKELKEYRAIGTVEEMKTAMGYIRIAKKHGTIHEVFDACAEYEALDLTPEQIRQIDALYREKCEELAEYKKLEEQGLILRLPCKVGDTIYFIGSKCDKCEEDDCYGCPYNRNGDRRTQRFLYEMTVEQFRVRNNTIYLVDTDAIFASNEISLNVNQIDKIVFLTKEAAEQKLAEMKGV